MGKCDECGHEYCGDKRARICADCAYAALPLPGSTIAGRRVLAVVEGLISQPEKRETGEAVMIWPKDDPPGPIITPITALILDREDGDE